MLKLGWFSTGRGPGSRNLLREVMERKDDGTLDVEFSFVFCNWDNTEEPNPKKDQRQMFFDMVEGYGIPLITLSWKTFRPDLWDSDPSEWRRLYGIEIRKRIQDLGFDLGILAGYMLWIDDETCEQYDFMNLHPALPTGPKGTWQEVIWQLIREGADEQGAMMHIVTPEWDRAPRSHTADSLYAERVMTNSGPISMRDSRIDHWMISSTTSVSNSLSSRRSERMERNANYH